MGRLIWSSEAWNDYLRWEDQDKKTLRRINRLILEIQRFGASGGVGKPEALRGDLAGLWSRRIDETNRLVYRLTMDDLEIVSCRTHYGDH